MTRQMQGRLGGAITFLLVAGLVIGGLGWVTWSALRVEAAQQDAAAEARLVGQIRLALWRLDSGMIAPLGLEDNRPYDHYALTCSPLNTWSNNNDAVASLRVPSPLVSCPVPDWMALHFQVDTAGGWASPQVPTTGESKDFLANWSDVPTTNVTDSRAKALASLRNDLDLSGTVVALTTREASLVADPLPAFVRPVTVEAIVQTASTSTQSLPPSRSPGFRFWGVELSLPSQPIAGTVPPQLTIPTTANSTGAYGSNITQDPVALGLQTGRGGISSLSQNFRYNVKNPQDLEQNNEFTTRAQIVSRGFNEQKQAYEFRKNTLAANGVQTLNGGNINTQGMPTPPNSGPLGKGLSISNSFAASAANSPRSELPPITPATVSVPTVVHLGALRPQWLKAKDGSEHLALIRAARLDHRLVYQGILLDWEKLQAMLEDEVKELFPEARFVPVHDSATVSPERAMTALPVQLDPGPAPETPRERWSPLRIGLALAWAAALLALAAVGLGGWSLLDLSERRIRFVSAVTHELRTPLTSLRLYLDLLTSGLITEEAKKEEYLQTLNCESERLHRLVDNVLNYARLENRSIRPEKATVHVSDLLQRIRETWQDRCTTGGRELVVVSTLPAERTIVTDANLVQQIVGNLIDNARKYSKNAEDRRIWLWARPEGVTGLVLEVEDRGPGIPAGERSRIFRPFRRGDDADTTAGGAGLGLALARQWSTALGGKLTYRPADGGTGACFRLELAR